VEMGRMGRSCPTKWGMVPTCPACMPHHFFPLSAPLRLSFGLLSRLQLAKNVFFFFLSCHLFNAMLRV
jgi:hypothetical protein